MFKRASRPGLRRPIALGVALPAALILLAGDATVAGGHGLSASQSQAPLLAGQGSAPPLTDLTPLPAVDLGSPIRHARVQHNPEPRLEPTPRAVCDADSHPLAGTQGRVPAAAIDSPAGEDGWTCNLARIGQHGNPGGWKVWRYVDRQGHECAIYDTSLTSPLNVVRAGAGPSPGVAVLDMSDPAHPVQTATLKSLPMVAPHESLNLNQRRGLLAAEMGNGLTLPALMAVYDVSRDCRHPVLQSTVLPTRFGHESGFSPDGNTYWIGGGIGIAAVDVRNPKRPRALWSGNVYAHGLSVSADGNRLYDAEPINGHLVILDVSQIQARRPRRTVHEISRLTWKSVTVPQNTAPMRINGRPYLLEFDEFGFRFSTVAPPDQVGAARIIDISDERRPRVVSNLRLAVNQPRAHRAANGDPTPLPAPVFNYSAHYCAIPRRVDPQIAACSFINSGLRIFNIEDPLHPREVAYHVAAPAAHSSFGVKAANFAVSKPAFVPERREVWYTDATSGFYVLRLDEHVWPRPTRRPAARTCGGRRATIVGTRGRDRLVGTRGRDVIVGLGGRDRIRGGGGNDVICAGAGRDRVAAGGGNDVVYGQSGNDRLAGGSGADRLRGSSGRDRLHGGSGRDRLRGERGADRLRGQGGNDRLAGGSGNDRLAGGSGRDRLYGGSGRDRLYGGPGRDRLYGGSGRDRLYGGSGRDRLSGGRGRDRLRQ